MSRITTKKDDMRKRRMIFLGVIFFFFVGVISWWYFGEKEESIILGEVVENQSEETYSAKDNTTVCSDNFHQMRFFDEELFHRTKSEIAQYPKDEERDIRGVVIPHHLLPGHIIAGTLREVSPQEISRIILLGPDHYQRSQQSIATSDYAWETPFGSVLCDSQSMALLEKETFIKKEPKVLEYEHSVSGLMPYIKYFFPDTAVTPLVIRPDITNEEVQRMSEILRSLLKEEGVLLVASVDFSHYLFSEEARENNKKTKTIMENREYGTLRSLNSDYVDSPESLEIFFRSLDGAGFGNMEILYDTDSGTLTGNPYGQTTSYFGIIMY